MKAFRKHYHPPGTPPGTLSAHTQSEAEVRLFQYNSQEFKETLNPNLGQCHASLNSSLIEWLDVVGSCDPELISEIGATFGLHPLTMEDILNGGQSSKIDFHKTHTFMIFNLPSFVGNDIELEQVSLFIGETHLLSFCSGKGTAFEPLRLALRQGLVQMRDRSINYLLYTLIDVTIDSAFPLLETLSERVEGLEEQVLENPSKTILSIIHKLKSKLLLLRRALWPQREVLSRLLHHSSVVDDELRPYFSDCYDHSVQILDLIETYREMLSGMIDIYLSSLSNRMNSIMRILTIISTIFIPLSFIVGVYGMNFNNPNSPWSMPELHWYYGYPLIWGVMLALAIAMIIMIKRLKWL